MFVLNMFKPYIRITFLFIASVIMIWYFLPKIETLNSNYIEPNIKSYYRRPKDLHPDEMTSLLLAEEKISSHTQAEYINITFY